LREHKIVCIKRLQLHPPAMMSFHVLVFATSMLFSEAAFYQAGSDASAARNTQPSSDEIQTEVVSSDVAEDIRERQQRRRAIREMQEQKLQAVREEADARAKQAMEASRNATLASDRARNQYHAQMKQAAQPPVVPSSTVVHLVHVPHKRNHTNHTSRKNHTNQTQVLVNKTEAVVQKPSLDKALTSKNVTHTVAHANASRLNVTKAVAKHKDQMTEKASGISNATKAAASKGVSAAFHSARLAAEKLRKNHLAKRANIAKEKKSTSEEESFEDKQKEKIKKNVIEVEGDELAEALKSVLSFPAKVPVTTTTTTTTTATTTTVTTTLSTAVTTTLASTVNSTNVTTDVAIQNTTEGTNNTADVASKDTKDSELVKIEAEIEQDKAEKQKAIEKDDLETALSLKKELGKLEAKLERIRAHAADPASQEAAVNKTAKSSAEQALKSPLKAARKAASKLRGSHE